MNESEDIQDHLPLSHLAFYILLMLAGGDLSPSELSARITERSAGVISCARAEVMEMIRKLAHRGYVEESPLQPDPDNYDDYQRSFTLTVLGMKVAGAEAIRVAGSLSIAVDTRLVTRDRLRAALPRSVLG